MASSLTTRSHAKIFIDHFNVGAIQCSNLDPYLVHEKTYIQLDSEKAGTVVIECNQKPYILEASLEDNYKTVQYTYNRVIMTLIVCNEKETRKKVLSQLPVDYVLSPITRCTYKINTKSQISLIIEYVKTQAIQCYFECIRFEPEQLFFQHEFNELLSILLKS